MKFYSIISPVSNDEINGSFKDTEERTGTLKGKRTL